MWKCKVLMGEWWSHLQEVAGQVRKPMQLLGSLPKKHRSCSWPALLHTNIYSYTHGHLHRNPYCNNLFLTANASTLNGYRYVSFLASRFVSSLLILAQTPSPPTTNLFCLPENWALIKGKQEAIMVRVAWVLRACRTECSVRRPILTW